MEIVVWIRLKKPLRIEGELGMHQGGFRVHEKPTPEAIEKWVADHEPEFKAKVYTQPCLCLQPGSILSIEDVFLPSMNAAFYTFNEQEQALQPCKACSTLRYTAPGLNDPVSCVVVGGVNDVQQQLALVYKQQNEEMIKMHNAAQLQAGIPPGAVLRR